MAGGGSERSSFPRLKVVYEAPVPERVIDWAPPRLPLDRLPVELGPPQSADKSLPLGRPAPRGSPSYTCAMMKRASLATSFALHRLSLPWRCPPTCAAPHELPWLRGGGG